MASTILDQVIIVGNVSIRDDSRNYAAASDNNNARFNFSVATTPHTLNPQTNQWEDGEPTWHNVTVYGSLAENLHDSLHGGEQVIIIGHNKTRTWKDSNTGEDRRATDVIADYAGVSLRFATATINKRTGGSSRPATSAPSRRASTPVSRPAPASADDDLSADGSNEFDELFS